ncbi:ribonuclease III [Rapidithrix thailandica]|uniref:Ribonuclease 3 n=1 Tax=Rapidithrix thailandica TaxID=413964 RepID=A0AAW9SB97_9BACT
MHFTRFFTRWIKNYSAKDKKLIEAVKRITGVKPYNVELYSLAMKHTSIAKENTHGFKESNERLEYLGDAVLGAVVAEYLFKRFPYKDEGFLTEIRSRIVNRESLNRLAIKIGLSQLVEYEGRKRNSQTFKSIYGDAMEAFVGAVYLDKGFKYCRKFIVKQLLIQHYDLEEIIETTTNFKSLIIEWAQKNNKDINFETAQKSATKKSNKQFKVKLLLDTELIAEGNGYSKKKAEQDAARKSCEALGIDKNSI